MRRPDEWARGVVDDDEHDVATLELDGVANLDVSGVSSLKERGKYVVHCKMGIRAVIAYTMLERKGIESQAYLGTWDDIVKSGISIKTP